MIDVGKIEKLMLLMSQYGFDVVQAESGSEKISLAKNVQSSGIFQAPTLLRDAASYASAGLPSGTSAALNATPAVSPAPTPSTVAPSPAHKSESTSPKSIPDGVVIPSPFVGTFYRSPAPDAPTFADIGTRVKKGQTLCIVEAMKLMNEIESEVDGEVVAILLENGKPVEFGTPLFVIRP